MSHLQARHVAAKISGSSRKVVENGREFLVAPIVAVREGVLNGELVRSDVLERLLDEWQNTPVTVHHPPKHLQSSISKTHAWVRQNEIGTMRGVHVAQQRLKGEIWIPTDTTNAAALNAIQRIERGEVLEVSVGFLSAYAQQQGTLGGKRFSEITQEAAPNHVALLPGDVGACSIEDGCGTPRAASANARGLEFSGVEATPWQQVDKSLAAYVRAAGKALGVDVREDDAVSNLPAAVREWIASRTLLGDVNATTADELLRAPVVNPATNRLNRAAVMAVFGHRVERLSIDSESKAQARLAAVALLSENFGINIDPRAASEEQDSMTGFPKIQGKRVGAVMSKVLDRAKNAADRNARIAQLATAAGIDAKRVKAIVAGEEEFTEERIIKTFADVLEISSGLLFSAAFGDDDEFMRALEQPVEPQPQESPMGFFNVSAALAAFKRWTGVTGGKTMKRCELESRIKAKGLTEKEAAALKDFSDANLKAFAQGINVDVEGFEPEVVAEPKDKSQQPTAAGAVTMEAIAALLEKNNAKLRTELKSEIAAENKAAQEASQRTALNAAAKAKGLTDEQITAWPIDALEAYVGRQAAVGMFAGAAGAPAPAAAETNIETRVKSLVNTPDPYDMKAIEQAQQSHRRAVN